MYTVARLLDCTGLQIEIGSIERNDFILRSVLICLPQFLFLKYLSTVLAISLKDLSIAPLSLVQVFSLGLAGKEQISSAIDALVCIERPLFWR